MANLNGLVDYKTITEVLHSLDAQTDANALQQTVVLYSDYCAMLAQKLKEQTTAGLVHDSVMDHLHVTAELLTRGVARLARLGAVAVIL